LEQPVTHTAFRLMTPAYASPEQLRGDSLTTASDMYTLGLLLYELLTGHPAHRITTDSPREVFEVVCEREPERPSSGVARDEQAASARDTTPEKLTRRLRGDLDAIVAMALRKEPSRRYGSAELFAADVGRYLDGLPVLAHRGSRWYRLEKTLRRHRAAAAFAAASVLVLVVGAGVALRLASVAARERDRASTALLATQRALGESEAVTEFLVGLFEASDPTEGRLDTLSAADLLRRGGARAERLGSAPLAQARMFEGLGRVHSTRGDLPLAAEFLRRALTLRRTHLGGSHAATASVTAQLADVLRRQGQYAAADTLAREALAIRRSTLGDSHVDVASSLNQLSGIAVYLGDLDVAERYAREAVAVRRRSGVANDSAMVSLLERLSSILWRRGEDAGAEGAVREAVAIGKHAFQGPHVFHALTVLRLADLLDERISARAEAESLYVAALAEIRAAVGESHPVTADAMIRVGVSLGRNGRTAEAERLIRQAIELQRRVWGSSNAVVASTMTQLVIVLTRGGYNAEAERLAREAIAMFGASLGTSHAAYAGALGYLGGVIALRGALDSAEVLQRRAVSIRTGALGPEHSLTALTALPLADVLTRQRRFTEADSVYRWALGLLRSRTTDVHVDVRRAYDGLATLYEAWGKSDSAAMFRRRAAPADRDLRNLR
jgi:serine/threonine-protein kinase